MQSDSTQKSNIRYIAKWLVVTVRLALGILFIYAGVQKFRPPEPRPPATGEVPEHVVKIRSLIGVMKQTGYFWETVGVAEILCGLMLVSQILATLGAIMLVPITLNIFLFHLFLTPQDMGDILLTALYLLANLALLMVAYPKLKAAVLPNLTTLSS